MKSLFIKVSSILLLCLPVFAANEIYITQVGTSNNFTLDILQDGDDNEVRLSVSHDNNNIDIDQIGDNNTISWVSYWGTGLGWGGDLDGSSNNLNFKQYNTTGSDSNKIGFHIPSNNNNVTICQGATFDSRSDTTCSGSTPGSEYGGHTVNLDLHSGGNIIKIGQENILEVTVQSIINIEVIDLILSCLFFSWPFCLYLCHLNLNFLWFSLFS